LLAVSIYQRNAEEFEDTKWVIRIHKSMKDRQHNDQKKNDKRTNKDLQSIVKRGKIYNLTTQIQDHSLSWRGTGASIKKKVTGLIYFYGSKPLL
jgi:hypothetical protein